jgi:hypothetical protein
VPFRLRQKKSRFSWELREDELFVLSETENELDEAETELEENILEHGLDYI